MTMGSKSIALNRLKQTSSLLQPRRYFESVTQGSKYSTTFKQYLKLANGEIGSFFHDVPINLNLEHQTVNMVCEVPRWSNAKFEISRDIDFNPIVQDTKKGEVRFVHNIFPYHGYIHNYGAIPQTWEDPTVASDHGPLKSLKGDNDPLDCCEIGSNILRTGDVKTVKILGSLALIDDGELDWKVIAIDTEDPMASRMKDLNDVNKHLPGLLDATREWFRNYKKPTGKPANLFAFNEQYRNVEDTIATIKECHAAWKKLTSDNLQADGIQDLPHIKRAGSQLRLEGNDLPEREIPSIVHKWWHV